MGQPNRKRLLLTATSCHRPEGPFSRREHSFGEVRGRDCEKAKIFRQEL